MLRQQFFPLMFIMGNKDNPYGKNIKQDKPGPNRFEDKKIGHESTKIRRHESLNLVLFRVFNLSYFWTS